VYPNALAGLLLLLLPAAFTLAWQGTRALRPAVRGSALALAGFLGLGCFYWTKSKAAWLIAIGMLGAWAWFRPRWPVRLRWGLLAVIVAGGLGVFALRFAGYFAQGATSVGARWDYWRAAAQTTRANPLLGTGPGTFQRPYARLKAPEAEMARLVHNDYLEQFTDSGVPGGLLYLGWIGALAWWLARRLGDPRQSPMLTALGLGLLGWWAQGFVEFGLYIPALAWPAATLAGWAVAWTMDSTGPEPAVTTPAAT
jgi:O-antigen ligase